MKTQADREHEISHCSAVAARLRLEGVQESDSFRDDAVACLNETTAAPHACIAWLDKMLDDGLTPGEVLTYDQFPF